MIGKPVTAGTKKIIYVIGFMASGKTTIGTILAGKLGFRFLDTDQVIETAENSPISRIFEEKGEGYFRQVEKKVLQNITREHRQEGAVVSTGGGMPCDPQNLEYMKKRGVLVYLKSTPEDIINRTKAPGSRPVFNSLRAEKNPEKAVKELLHQREKYYTQADIIVVNSRGAAPEKVADEVIRKLKQQSR
ncbi:MAG: shikimate kinase [Spirochaetota bacterium]